MRQRVTAADGTDFIRAIIRIKVIGVGGGGNSVIARLAEDKMPGVELIAVNTEAKQLAPLQAAGIKTLQIGERLTRGRGCGGNVALGAQAAQDDMQRLRMLVKDADLVFVTSSMGGGAGTGAAPVIARMLYDMDILSIGVVTVPFGFEGKRKMQTAEAGVLELRAVMDGLLVIHNDNLLQMFREKISMVQAFREADNTLRQAIRCITELILTTGTINVDFADMTTIFRQSESSDALLGIGFSAQGNVLEAVEKAITSPLIERPIDGARGLIMNISGDETLPLYGVTEAAEYLYEHTDPEVNIIFGTVLNASLGKGVQATIIATDFADSMPVKLPPRTQRDLSAAVAGAVPNATIDERAEMRDVSPAMSFVRTAPPQGATQQAPQIQVQGTKPVPATMPPVQPAPSTAPQTGADGIRLASFVTKNKDAFNPLERHTW